MIYFLFVVEESIEENSLPIVMDNTYVMIFAFLSSLYFNKDIITARGRQKTEPAYVG